MDIKRARITCTKLICGQLSTDSLVRNPQVTTQLVHSDQYLVDI